MSASGTGARQAWAEGRRLEARLLTIAVVERVLLISNARAGAVSPRTKEVIAKALSADFKLEVADTAARGHASELSRDAAGDGFDAVVAFGGDGTINEAAQGVVGSETALGILPGGSTNVMARSFGMPTDPVDATAFLAARLRARETRRVNVGRMDDRYFLFSAGMGLDAEVVRRTEARPESKRKWGEWSFAANAVTAAFTRYRGAPARITVEVEGREVSRAVLAVCSNARPFTYFKRWPIDACPEASLDSGLDIFALRKVHLATIPRVAWGILVSRSHIKWRISRYEHDVSRFTLSADEPMPVQVDGEYLGERSHADFTLVRSALDLLV